MDFSDAVIFLGAVIVIIAAGAVLGASLRGRSSSANGATAPQTDLSSGLAAKKSELYSEIIGALDGISSANDQRKQWFIHRYYQALVTAPDGVIQSLNRFLDAVTDPSQPADRLMELRGEVIKEMRSDVQAGFDTKSNLPVPELYKIEVRKPEGEAQPTREQRREERSSVRTEASNR